MSQIGCKIGIGKNNLPTVVNDSGNTPQLFKDLLDYFSFLPEVARHNKAVETWAIASTDAFMEVTGKDEDTATAKELFAFLKDAQQQGQKLSPDNLFEVRHIMSTYGFNSLSELSTQLEKIFRKDGISQVDFNQAIKSGLYGTDDIRTLNIPLVLDLMDQVQGELMVGNNFEVEPQETYDTYERPQGVLNIPQKITLREVVDRVKEQVQDFSNEQEILEAIQEVSPPAFQEKFDTNEEFRREFLKGFEGMRRVPVQVVENGELVSLTKRQSLLRNTFPANLDITRISARFKYLQSIPELIWLNSTEELKRVLDNLENYFIEQGIDVIGLKDMSQENVLRTLNATIESAQTGNTDILADTLDSILGAEQFSKIQRFGENLKDTTLLYIDSELSQQELFEQQGLIKVKGNIYQKVSLTEPIQDIYSYIEDTPAFKQRQDKKQTVEQYVRSLEQGLPFKNDRAQAYRIVFEHEPLPKQDVSSLQTLDKERTEYLKNEYPLDFYKDILRGKKMDTLRHKFNKWTINGQDIVPMDDVIAEDIPPTLIEYAKLSRNEELRQYLPEMNDSADPVLQAINFPEQTPEHFSQYKRYGTNILTPRNSTEVIKINGELYALVGQDDMSSVYSKLVYSKQDNRYFTTEAFAQTNQDQIDELLELGQRAHQSIETADELNKKTGLSSTFMKHLQETAKRTRETPVTSQYLGRIPVGEGKFVRYNPDDVLPLLLDYKPTNTFVVEDYVNQTIPNDASIEAYKIVPIEAIKPSEKIESKDRKTIEEIKKRIKKGDDIPPLLLDFTSVIKKGETYEFGLMDGHHRYVAYKELGIKAVPTAIITSREHYTFETNDVSVNTLFQTETSPLKNQDTPRFMILGEKGAQALDLAEESTRRLDNLAVAREMEAAGKTPLEIRVATEWERGADSKWKLEIADPKKINKESFEKAKTEEILLKDLIEEDETLSIYPKLSQTKVVVKQGSTGLYNTQSNTIILPDGSDSITIKSILLHELQHAIQHIEGFSFGTTGDREMLVARSILFEEVGKKLYKENKEYRELFIKAEQLPFYINDTTLEKNKEREETEERMSEIYEEYLTDNPIKEEEVLERAKKKYKENKGEIEARNVQERMNMSPQERINTLLQETEDVAREDQLILFEGLTAAQELSPQSNNIGSPILQQLSNQLLKLGTVTKLSFLSPKQLQDYLTEKGISVKLAQQVIQNYYRNENRNVQNFFVRKIYEQESDIATKNKVVVGGKTFTVKKHPVKGYILNNKEHGDVKLTVYGGKDTNRLETKSSFEATELSWVEVFPQLKDVDTSYANLKKYIQANDVSELYPIIEADNYHIATKGDFSKISEEDYNKIDAEEYVSDFGSRYKVKDNTLYRKADHWGSFATVTWTLDGRPTTQKYIRGKLQNITEAGKIPLQNLKRVEGVVTILDEKALERAKLQVILSEKGLKLTPQGLYNPSTREVIVNEQAVDPANTMIHEFAHAFFHIVREKRPDVYQAGMNLINKNKKEAQAYINLIKQLQPDLVEGTQEFNEEVLTQIISDNGSRLVKSKVKGSLSTWLKDLWTAIKDILALSSYTAEQVSQMTIQQFSDAVLKDMFSGQDINELYQEAQEYFTREADRLPLTLSVFSRPEFTKLQGSKVKPITVLNLLNQQGIKQIEKDLIKQIIDKNYPDQKQIPYDELEATVRANIMPLERLFTSSYAGYGMDKLGNGNYGNANTIIFNAPIEHGVTGHFSGDFKASSRTSIKYVPKQLNDNTWVAVDEKYTEDSNPNNIYQYVGTAGTKESVDAWIEEYESFNGLSEKEEEELSKLTTKIYRENLNKEENERRRYLINKKEKKYINKGMFGHIRVWQDNDIFYTAELQSDTYQKQYVTELLTQQTINSKEHSFTQEQKDTYNSIFKDMQWYRETYFEQREYLKKRYGKDFLKEALEEEIEVLNESKKTYEDKKQQYEKEVVDKARPLFSKQEKQFIASQKEWEKRMVRETIKEASLSGATELRFPTPYTLSVIEGYITAERGKRKLPYTIISASNEETLEVGDTINYLNEDKIVYEASDTIIKIVNKEMDLTDEIIEDIQAGEDSDDFIRKNKISDRFLMYKGVILPNGKILFTEMVEIPENTDEENISSLFKEQTTTSFFDTYKKEIEDFTEEKYTEQEWKELIEDSDGTILQKRPHTTLKDASNVFNGDIPSIGYLPTNEEISALAKDYTETYRIVKGRVLDISESETLQQPSLYKERQKDTFKIEDLSETQQTVARKYLEIADILKEERGSENFTTVTDENGFDWYSTKLTENDTQQPVVAFNQVPITIQQAIQRNNNQPLNLAPNGNPSILYRTYQELGYDTQETERLVAQTYSDQFGEFFGRWWENPQESSKVVDANMQPLVVWHGSPFVFNEFSTEYGKYTKGTFFSTKLGTASIYGNTRPFFIKANNIKEVGSGLPGVYDLQDIENTSFDGLWNKGTNEVVVGKSNQIKSATENIGTFSTESNDIRFSVAPVNTSQAFAKQMMFDSGFEMHLETEENLAEKYDTCN